jgi:DNA modification methylase
MNWQFLYDHAIKAGFRVQRWPFIWHKTHQCMNQRAEFNFTKNFEIAMVCRKPSSVLIKPQNSSIFSCSASGYMSNPFAKPSPLWDHLIEAISISGQTILDPFAGEGSCPSAVLSNWRIPIGIELEDRHYNVMLDTLKSKYNLMYRNPQFV